MRMVRSAKFRFRDWSPERLDLPNHPSLLLVATWPILAHLAAAAGVYWWQRSVGALVATLFSMGVALLVAFLLVFLIHGSSALYQLGDSFLVLVGIPLLVYAAMLAALTRRKGIPLSAAMAAGLAGLAGLWVGGGRVLIGTACSFNTGGC